MKKIALFFLIFSAISVQAMKETTPIPPPTIVKQKQKERPLLATASKEDLAIAKAMVGKAMSQLQFPITRFDERSYCQMVACLEGDLPELVEQQLCQERLELYKKLLLNPRGLGGWWANYGTLFGFRFVPGVKQLKDLNIGSISLQQLPDLSELELLTNLSCSSNKLTGSPLNTSKDLSESVK